MLVPSGLPILVEWVLNLEYALELKGSGLSLNCVKVYLAPLWVCHLPINQVAVLSHSIDFTLLKELFQFLAWGRRCFMWNLKMKLRILLRPQFHILSIAHFLVCEDGYLSCSHLLQKSKHLWQLCLDRVPFPSLSLGWYQNFTQISSLSRVLCFDISSALFICIPRYRNIVGRPRVLSDLISGCLNGSRLCSYLLRNHQGRTIQSSGVDSSKVQATSGMLLKKYLYFQSLLWDYLKPLSALSVGTDLSLKP